jgi:hypothetical protein
VISITPLVPAVVIPIAVARIITADDIDLRTDRYHGAHVRATITTRTTVITAAASPESIGRRCRGEGDYGGEAKSYERFHMLLLRLFFTVAN